MSFLVKKHQNHFRCSCQAKIGLKIHKKLIEFFHKSVILTVAAKIGENVFFSQSENHFLNIPADILVSSPVILLFWSLSLSSV